MIVILWWKDDKDPTFLKSVEIVREVKGGIEVKCFGNDPVIHPNERLSTFAVVKEHYLTEDEYFNGEDNEAPIVVEPTYPKLNRFLRGK